MVHRRSFGRVLVALAIVCLGPVAHAAVARAQVDLVEQIFGASNVNAITGNGHIAVGVSIDGDVSVLSYPSPSYCDQVGYVAANGPGARELPRFGASEGAGMFLGLVVTTADGTSVTWLRDRDTWTASQDYGAGAGPNVETRYASARLGLDVVVTDAVDADADVYVRRVAIDRAATSPVTAAALLTYANLSPLPPESRVPQLPVVDWAYDGRNDFAAVWDDAHDAVLAFHPGDQRIRRVLGDLLLTPTVSYGPVGDALRAGTPDDAALAALVDGLDDAYAAGAYLALTTVPPPDQHQIGYDATPFCDDIDRLVDNLFTLSEMHDGFSLPIDVSIIDALRCDRTAPSIMEAEGFVHDAGDALSDAADGELSMSGLAAGEVNEALRTPIAFDAAGHAEVGVVLGAGRTASEARGAIAGAGDDTVDDVVARAEAAFDAWIAGVRLPTVGSDHARAVARRALANIRVGTDRETGAIVASISRQAPYGLDWPRDGAFFDLALDVSGQTELVTRRRALYDMWQRKTPGIPTPILDPMPPPSPDGPSGAYPAGAWEMNYYADGKNGGTWRFEIDEVGLAVWYTVAHVGWVGSPRAYLRERWDSIVLATELLVRWRDPETGLHFPAQEDDNAPYTQTLHGAVTTFLGIEMASRAARMLGEDALAAAWEDRAAELRDAILTHFYDEDAGVFVSDAASGFNPGSAPTGPTAWLVFPARLLPWDDERINAQLASDLAVITPIVSLETEGGAYWVKNTLSLALARGDDPEIGPQVLALLEQTADHAMPGTLGFGEVTVPVDDGMGGRRASQRVSNPHLWEGTLFYLSLMALEDPHALQQDEDVLPASRVPAPFMRGAASGEGGTVGGAGCDAGGGGSGGLLLIAVALAASFVGGTRARRRRSRSSR